MQFRVFGTSGIAVSAFCLGILQDTILIMSVYRVNIFSMAVEACLRRLKTDYIALYQVHTWHHITPIDEH
jgi:aryl-alcohol dehydrogenase-like predicted oxidoreductase